MKKNGANENSKKSIFGSTNRSNYQENEVQMKRQNCWEVMKCGREPGGKNVEQLSVCPAALANQYDGINKGTLGGRICWVVTGTLCEGEVHGTYAKKLITCLNCKFLKQVNEDEGRFFVLRPKAPQTKKDE